MIHWWGWVLIALGIAIGLFILVAFWCACAINKNEVNRDD